MTHQLGDNRYAMEGKTYLVQSLHHCNALGVIGDISNQDINPQEQIIHRLCHSFSRSGQVNQISGGLPSKWPTLHRLVPSRSSANSSHLPRVLISWHSRFWINFIKGRSSLRCSHCRASWSCSWWAPWSRRASRRNPFHHFDQGGVVVRMMIMVIRWRLCKMMINTNARVEQDNLADSGTNKEKRKRKFWQKN